MRFSPAIKSSEPITAKIGIKTLSVVFSIGGQISPAVSKFQIVRRQNETHTGFYQVLGLQLVEADAILVAGKFGFPLCGSFIVGVGRGCHKAGKRAAPPAPSKEKSAAESFDGYILWGGRELERKFRLNATAIIARHMLARSPAA